MLRRAHPFHLEVVIGLLPDREYSNQLPTRADWTRDRLNLELCSRSVKVLFLLDDIYQKMRR